MTLTQTARCRRHGRIILDTHPVIAVTSVTVDGTLVDEADPNAGTDGWELDPGPGILRHTGYWPYGDVAITYRAGRTPLPGNVRLAALELVAHLWKTIKLQTQGSRPAVAGGDAVVVAGTAYALPNRVRELLGLGRNPTAGVLVG